MVESGSGTPNTNDETSERPEPPTTIMATPLESSTAQPSSATSAEPPTNPMTPPGSVVASGAEDRPAETPSAEQKKPTPSAEQKEPTPSGEQKEPAPPLERKEPVWPGLTAAGLPTRVPRRGSEEEIREAFIRSWEAGPSDPTPLVRKPFTPSFLTEPPRPRLLRERLDVSALLRTDSAAEKTGSDSSAGGAASAATPSAPAPTATPTSAGTSAALTSTATASGAAVSAVASAAAGTVRAGATESREPVEPPEPKEPPRPPEPPQPKEPPQPAEPPEPPKPKEPPSPTPPGPSPFPAPSPVPTPPTPVPPTPVPSPVPNRPPVPPVPPPPPPFPPPPGPVPPPPTSPVTGPRTVAFPRLGTDEEPTVRVTRTPIVPGRPGGLPVTPGSRVTPGSTVTPGSPVTSAAGPSGATPFPRPTVGASIYTGGGYADMATEPITGMVRPRPGSSIEMSGSLTGYLLARNQELYRRQERRRKLKSALWVALGLTLFAAGIAIVVNLLAGDFLRSIFSTFAGWSG